MELKLFPRETRDKVYQRFIGCHNDKLIPVVLFFHREKAWREFKQYMLVAVDPEYSVHQLIQTLQLKLIWNGYLTTQNNALFINIGQMQMTTSLDKKVRVLYDSYRQDDGWLELNLTTLSTFG